MTREEIMGDRLLEMERRYEERKKKAKLIRTEKTEWGLPLYYFECSKCGNEYYRWSYSKRTTCLCSDCYKKRQREQAKAWQKRKLQEYADKVLEDIKTEIINIPITDTDGHSNNWYREPQAIIDDVLKIIDKHIGGKE